MDLGFSDKVAIITGGSEGIGKAAAQRMAEEGARVVIVARTPDKLEQAAQDIRTATEGVVLPVAADVCERDTADKVVQAALDNFGRVDILVNNAGMSIAKPFEEVTDDEWEFDFNLKVWGAVRLIRRSVPEMRKVGGGRIINVTNLAARTPGAGSMPTSISRAAGIAITKGLSRDLAGDNILVNTVCIGIIKSGQHTRRYDRLKADNPDLDLEDFYVDTAARRGVPLGRIGETEEAGDVITFLASERASYLTGIAINIDGGTSPVV
ncbi:MAG: SDR family NAD(P)-dependent oxidoreductase [Dehalococcoidia bacterium]